MQDENIEQNDFAPQEEERIPIQEGNQATLDIQKQKQRDYIFKITIAFCVISFSASFLLGYNLFFSGMNFNYGKELFYFVLALFIAPSVLLLNLIKGCYQSDKIDDVPSPTKLLIDHLRQ